MKLSIIIPAYNEERYIGECLKSCLKYAPPNLVDIIVVDNASTDKTAEIAKAFPSPVRVVHEPEKGLSKARQCGFKAATGDVFISIDADTRVPKGWFEAMQRELSKPNVVCVSGPYYYYDIPRWKRFWVDLYWDVSAAFTQLFTKYMVIGGNYAVKRDAMMKIGGLDESIKFYGEDTDVGRRLHKIGIVHYSPDCWIYSSGRRLNKEGLPKMFFVYVLNYFWIIILRRPFSKTHKDIR